MKRLFLCVMLMSLTVASFSSVSLALDPAPRITDREIIEGLVELKAGQKALEQRIDGLQNLIYVLISAIFAQTIGLVGFVLWDRRTTLAPVARKTAELTEELLELRQKARELERKLERIERAHAAA